MARHDTDPVLQQLVRAINESGQAAVPVTGHHVHIRTGPGRDGAIGGLWRISLEAVDGRALGAEAAIGGDDRGPFARLLGNS